MRTFLPQTPSLWAGKLNQRQGKCSPGATPSPAHRQSRKPACSQALPTGNAERRGPRPAELPAAAPPNGLPPESTSNSVQPSSVCKDSRSVPRGKPKPLRDSPTFETCPMGPVKGRHLRPSFNHSCSMEKKKTVWLCRGRLVALQCTARADKTLRIRARCFTASLSCLCKSLLSSYFQF